MQEIELKFQVDEIKAVKSRLKKLGCHFSEVLEQKDTVFVQNINDTSSEKGKVFIRIRTVNGKSELNLKKQSSKLMQSKEIEFKVSSFESTYDFLDTLGLSEWVTVEKQRITTEYKNCNICIDEVKRLGSFIEIEIVTEEEEKTEYYEKEILKVAKEIGIDIKNRVNSFYDTMINKLDEKK